MKRDKKTFYIILAAAELLLLAAAFAVIVIQKRPVSSVLNTGMPVHLQLVIGAVAGLLLGICSALAAGKIRLFAKVKELIEEVINGFKLGIPDFLIISMAAAVCEEMLFRVIIQGYLGIWLTSFIFILIHGYFNPKSLGMSVFGVFMLLLSSLIGYAYEYMGFLAAVSLHFFFDFTAFIVAATGLKVLTSKV